MSAIQWSGGKLHGGSEAKVQGFLHDTKDTRLIHGHSNPDMLRGVLEHEKKAAHQENAKAVRNTMQILYNAHRTQDSWLHEAEEEFIRSRQQRRGSRFASDYVAGPTRPLPTIRKDAEICFSKS